jgi:hypothetical protein
VPLIKLFAAYMKHPVQFVKVASSR